MLYEATFCASFIEECQILIVHEQRYHSRRLWQEFVNAWSSGMLSSSWMALFMRVDPTPELCLMRTSVTGNAR